MTCIYRTYRYSAVLSQPLPLLPVPHYPIPFVLANPPFYLLGEPAFFFLLVVRIPIHSCPRFAINCSPLAASPTPRHPRDQVTYFHRRHQQHQPSRLIHKQLMYSTVSAKKNGRFSKIIRFFKFKPMRVPDDFRSVLTLIRAAI